MVMMILSMVLGLCGVAGFLASGEAGSHRQHGPGVKRAPSHNENFASHDDNKTSVVCLSPLPSPITNIIIVIPPTFLDTVLVNHYRYISRYASKALPSYTNR